MSSELIKKSHKTLQHKETSNRAEFIAKSPIVKSLTLAVLKKVSTRKLSYEKKYSINSDLVPRLSEFVALASMGEEEISTHQKTTTQSSKEINQDKEMQKLAQPIPRVKNHQKQIPLPKQPPVPGPQFSESQVQSKPVQGNYGKITPLLNDPSVTAIQCQGPNKQIFVRRMGQKQLTKISLTKQEIKDIIKEIAHQARIPVIEGVFRAAVENFTINAIISTNIDTKFIIKKQTPYSILEQNS